MRGTASVNWIEFILLAEKNTSRRFKKISQVTLSTVSENNSISSIPVLEKCNGFLRQSLVCSGILICGMYGMGKTTLAKKICKAAMRDMELKYVDLRYVQK